jgi:hypothetical protein
MATEGEEAEAAVLEDYWTLQPRRAMVESWLKEPFLKAALEGNYVRYVVGEVGANSVCRMCKVVSVDMDGRPYQLASSKAQCTVRLTLAFAGSVRKQMRICQVSNHRLTQDEFVYYFQRGGEK